MSRRLKKGCRMRDIRIERGWTVEAVARMTHYTTQTIIESELGKRNHADRKDKRRDAFWETMSQLYGIPAEELRRWPDT